MCLYMKPYKTPGVLDALISNSKTVQICTFVFPVSKETNDNSLLFYCDRETIYTNQPEITISLFRESYDEMLRHSISFYNKLFYGNQLLKLN